MKTWFLVSALALMASTGPALASVTIYTDGSTYNSATGVTTPAPRQLAQGNTHSATDAPLAMFRNNNDPKVVRWGPPESGLGGT